MSHPVKYKIRIIICMWKILLTQAILHEYYIICTQPSKKETLKVTRLITKYWVSNITFHE